MRMATITTSFLIHLLLFIGLFLISTKITPTKLEPIQIQVVSENKAQLVTKKSGKSVSEINRQQKIQREKSLEILGLSSISASALYNKNVIDESSESTNHKAVVASGLPFSEFDEVELHDITFFKSLWRQIDKSIVNSPYLSEYGHTGKVQLNFEISSDGRLVESSIKASAQDNILKVIAIRAVRKALKNDTKELYKLNKDMLMTAQFTWTDYESCKELKGTHKNLLSFCSGVVDERNTFSETEKVTRYLEALRYGPGALDEIRKYNKAEDHKKTKFDPFTEYRNDPDWKTGA